VLLLAALLLATGVHATPPEVRMVTPTRLGAGRFVVLRVTGAARTEVRVNGVVAGRRPAGGRIRVRPRFGWEPGRLYRLRVVATAEAGETRELSRSVRARNFGIRKLATRDLRHPRPGRCGYVHLRPRRFRLGRAPLAVGDSVMLGAAWRLTRAGFESDTMCARSPLGGSEVLRKRRRRGTLPPVVVVGLGTNAPVTRADVGAMLRVLGPRRRLLLVTPVRHGRGMGVATLLRAARRHPARVGVIRWDAVARRHPGWVLGDGTHLRPAGLPGYTRMLHRAVWPGLRGEYVVC
jgi:hypothetical protein